MNVEKKETIKGLVFDIQRFSIHDGPGIRTTVFLKGCPLSCTWCHNPESQSTTSELFFNKNSCIDCNSCGRVCPFGNAREILSYVKLRNEKCESCDLCADICPTKAIEKVGKIFTSDEIVTEAEKDLPFYESSNGGVTLSGGEPLFQYDFAFDVLQKLKKNNIHTAIETSGYVNKAKLLKIVPFVDLFLWDIKITDKILHKKHTGVALKPIIENLKLIDKAGAKTILRLIIIPDVNMNDVHYQYIAKLYTELVNVKGIELLQYHDMGNSKMDKLGLNSYITFRKPTDQNIDHICNAFTQIDNRIKIFR